jgi:CrcB protein
VLAAVFAGGCVGGLVRYLVAKEWPTSTHLFPWPTFTVNIAGAFILALLIVIVSDVLGPSRYLRPLLGTGFCGALTTFSSVVVTADELIAHGHADVAAGYLAATILAGLAAGALGLVVGRSFAASRNRTREGR